MNVTGYQKKQIYSIIGLACILQDEGKYEYDFLQYNICHLHRHCPKDGAVE